jgi:putative tryptophan/tyrosine transport system substrate-binding protein
MIQRREFISLLGGVAAAWPFAARAQQSTMPVVGFLGNGSPEANVYRVTGFRKGLSEAGYVEGRNVAIEFRWAHNDDTRLSELALDLVRRRVAVLVDTGLHGNGRGQSPQRQQSRSFSTPAGTRSK